MSEAGEAIIKRRMSERRFARERGLVPANTPLRASRAKWAAATKAPTVQRISGQDARRAGGNVDKARGTVARTGYTYYRKPQGSKKKSGPRINALKGVLTRKTGRTTAQREADKTRRLRYVPKQRK